ncbi:UDP-glucose 4-epimerase GalE [Streptococcus parasanguinis]|jgi:UDP-glucose 4-epimerase|uniref:UDP-glucose 4-epimerase GalE n=1 Tax=Streptococcus parasanguinis TaxID=1318 RepID=UPI001896DC81|nr:UDP-glucose 4-epimerase GalE [Streptococcus parasanguinis]MDB8626102.1 UDP-glucose 4-epimerase GalE [Streptococcus parasanguinis]
MVQVLVTGGTGYIGSHTVVELMASNFEVVVVDDFSNSSPEVLNRLKIITGQNIRFYKGSILDKELINQIFRENHIQIVIHFAAHKAVGESVYNPLKYYDNNVVGTLSLLEVMVANGVKNIVFSSSATVYGMNNLSPLTEDLPTSAINPYGNTKLMNEQILCDLANADPDWSITNLRYFNPIGAHETGLIGEAPNGVPSNLMPYITQVAIGKLEALSIYGADYDTPDGTGVRDYIHVVDLAKGHVIAVKHNLKSKGTNVYNLGTGQGYSVLDLVNAFEKENNIKIPYIIKNRRPGDVATCYADTTKAEKELGWKSEKSIEDMVIDSWRWQKNNPNGY